MLEVFKKTNQKKTKNKVIWVSFSQWKLIFANVAIMHLAYDLSLVRFAVEKKDHIWLLRQLDWLIPNQTNSIQGGVEKIWVNIYVYIRLLKLKNVYCFNSVWSLLLI